MWMVIDKGLKSFLPDGIAQNNDHFRKIYSFALNKYINGLGFILYTDIKCNKFMVSYLLKHNSF